MAMSVTESGKYLTGNEELQQSLDLYFRTPKGSICLHPELGFAIFDYVDKNYTTVLNLIREARTGIALWDNRINVLRVMPLFETGKLKVTVKWNPVDQPDNVIQSPFYI